MKSPHDPAGFESASLPNRGKAPAIEARNESGKRENSYYTPFILMFVFIFATPPVRILYRFLYLTELQLPHLKRNDAILIITFVNHGYDWFNCLIKTHIVNKNWYSIFTKDVLDILGVIRWSGRRGFDRTCPKLPVSRLRPRSGHEGASGSGAASVASRSVSPSAASAGDGARARPHR